MIQLRPEQRITVDKAMPILSQHGIVYLAAEVRVGKNFMSMTIAKESGWKRVAFITKKKALIGVVSDYEKFGNGFVTFIPTNFEQVKKLLEMNHDFDGVIIDEGHALGQYPKPSERTYNMKKLIGDRPVIIMSGTPHPESPSQIFHQFWVTSHGPFKGYKNFYRWADDYVKVRNKIINGWRVNDYSGAIEDKVREAIAPYTVHLSQVEAGFTSMVEEEILYVKIDERLYRAMNTLKKDRIYKLKNGEALIADTPVKLQSLWHQLSSGTVTLVQVEGEKEVRKRYVLDESKAWYIKGRFDGHKIAIFFKFIAEGELLREIFPNHTDDPEVFNKKSDITFICQVVSGREGVNLSTADALVMYNIDFSATSYWQARARMQTKDRVKASKLYWIFSERGIEMEVYKAVSKKLNFTSQFFNKAFGIKWPKKALSSAR